MTSEHIAPTSRAALAEISLSSQMSMMDRIELVITNAMRNGAKDMSMKEVQAALERTYGLHVELSSISGRVNALVNAKRVVRDKLHPRTCSVTGRSIEPLSVAAEQERMFY